jgi:hypothetical protein
MQRLFSKSFSSFDCIYVLKYTTGIVCYVTDYGSCAVPNEMNTVAYSVE